ncbi:MAG: sulfotransferase family protein, partial [Luteolibacter sp.]
MPTTIVNLLSGPRNVSTALMYAFAQRGDTAVVDEPLYGHYLALTAAPQPGLADLLEVLETDGAKTIRETILSPPPGREVYFVKNMAHHLIGLDDSWLEDPRIKNVFLIRDPEQMLPSLVNQIAEPTARDAAYAAQATWFNRLHDKGLDPVVLDSKELLTDPPTALASLCASIGLDFDPAMLSWQPGPRPEDGAWAPHWYHNVHQ